MSIVERSSNGDAMAVTPPITRDELHELACLRAPSPMTTCYIDVDGRRFARPQDLHKAVDTLLRRAREQVNGDRSVQGDLYKISEFVRSGVDRSSTRGLAIFSNQATDFWKVVALPTPVPSHVTVGNSPAVGPLEVALNDHEPIGVLLVDKTKVRMLVFSWGELVDHSELVTELLAYDIERGGREQAHLENRSDERQARHLRAAARIAFDVQSRTGFERLVMGGFEPAMAEVERHLHPYLRKIYHGRVDVGIGVGLDELAKVVVAVEGEITRAREASLVERLRDAVGRPHGRSAVVGLDHVLGALANHRVERILVSEGFEHDGWRCEACDRLALVGPTCPACGTRMVAIADVVSEAIDRAIAERARVDVCVGNADLDVLGRIGALLRY
jgi:peptide subunit release factor 1 (eRF1)